MDDRRSRLFRDTAGSRPRADAMRRATEGATEVYREGAPAAVLRVIRYNRGLIDPTGMTSCGKTGAVTPCRNRRRRPRPLHRNHHRAGRPTHCRRRR